MALFKKKKKVKTEEFIDPNLDIELEFSKRNDNSHLDKSFKEIEDMQFVRVQCEQVVESSKYIEELKDEKMAVQGYILDMQRIEQAPENIRKALAKKSDEIKKLDKKRQSLQDRQPSLPRSRTNVFERYEEDFPKALTNLQNDEKYCHAVEHDMRLLEAEKASLKEDMQDYTGRHQFVKNGAVMFLFVITIVFAIFFISGVLNSQGGKTLFMTVMLLSCVLIALIFVLQRRNLYMFKLSEKKLARTVTLLNKTKIKYVNIFNSVDYQHEKYGVKNAYQLGKEYEAYLTDKNASEKYHSSVVEMDYSLQEILRLLEGLNLYDVSVWEKQFSSLSDEKEMKEIKSRLEKRRKKLNDQINYNIERIDAAKRNVIDFVKKHPDKAEQIMEIVDSYDFEMSED